jgi:hypothetical protein
MLGNTARDHAKALAEHKTCDMQDLIDSLLLDGTMVNVKIAGREEPMIASYANARALALAAVTILKQLGNTASDRAEQSYADTARCHIERGADFVTEYLNLPYDWDDDEEDWDDE